MLATHEKNNRFYHTVGHGGLQKGYIGYFSAGPHIRGCGMVG
jgi:hypothetical protein